MSFVYQIRAGTTDVSVVIRIIDSTDGTPETGVAFGDAGLVTAYRREGAASVPITEATLAALTTAHADGGFLHIGNGYYRLDLPDAACAAGSSGVLVHGTNTGMVVIGCYIQLVAYNPFDAVRLGLTALPNAAADAAGGLPVSDAGGLDLDARLDAAISTRSTFNVASDVVTVDPDQAPAVTPTVGTFDDMLLKATTALPIAAPGASAGLALAYNIFAIAATGTVATVTDAGDFTLDFTGYLGSHATDGQFARMFLVFDRNQAADNAGIPRQITTYTGATRRVQFSGTGTDIDRPFPTAPTGGENVTILGLA